MTNPLSSKPLKAVSVPSGSSPDWVAVELVKEFDDNSGPPSGARFGIRGLFIVTAIFSFQFALVSYLGGWAGVMLSPLIALCMISMAAIGEIAWGRRIHARQRTEFHALITRYGALYMILLLFSGYVLGGGQLAYQAFSAQRLSSAMS